MAQESSIKDIINNSLEQLRTLVDANTVLGSQIVTPNGTTIIPVSKISMGFASGGLDVPSKKTTSKSFGGGGGTGVSVTPLGFLVVSPQGHVEMLGMPQEKTGTLDQIVDLLDRTPDLITRLKSALAIGDADEFVEDAAKTEAEYEEKLRKMNQENK
ncbi:MAG: sporulation protein YtfJ [Clostridia bacterium]|nr:sporulation protein YtfJ [Clostridia bacterium]